MKADVLIAGTIRELVDIINSNNIKKDNIVTILPQGENFFLIYYK